MFICLLACCIGFSSALQAQKLSKEEKKLAKEWKKKLKALSPLEFKAIVDEKDELQTQVNTADTELAENRKTLLAKEEQINTLKAENAKLEKEVSMEVDASPKSEKGVVFKVQIGAYEGIDITDQANDNTDLGAETSGSVKKYTLGYFRDYWEADKFKKYIRAMGLKDAWIVAYRDGKRVDVKDVLEGVI